MREKEMQALRKSPKGSPSQISASFTLQHLFDLDSGFTSTSKLCVDSEVVEILNVIYHCSFSDSSVHSMETASHLQLRRLKLMQLLSIIKTLKKPLDDQILKPLFSLLSSSLFRPLPSLLNSVISVLPDDDDIVSSLTVEWPHLQLIYDILLRVIITIDAKSLRYYIDNSFVLSLLYPFQSGDVRERESLKNVFHRIYSKFTFYRGFMRKAMNDVFLHYAFETDQRHCGIGDLLEIWGSIINGFSVPLKEEHKLFLMRVLIPLHKPKNMQVYHRQLAYCVSQFVQKDPVLGGVAVRGILRYWPVTNCQKEVLLIGELEELIENLDPDQYRKLALPICNQITKCLNCWNSQRALYLWNNVHFVKLAWQAMEEVFPVLVGGMEKNLKCHWSKSVQQLTENVKVMLEEMKPGLYTKCLQKLELQQCALLLQETKRKEKWDIIEIAAAAAAAAARNQFLHQPHYICVSNEQPNTSFKLL